VVSTTTIADDYSPRYVGDLANPLVILFRDHQGIPYPIGGLNLQADFSLTLIPIGGGLPKEGEGYWNLFGVGSDGLASYSWAENDVSEAGIFMIRAAICLTGKWLHFDAKIIEFKDPETAG
jgi:hypothetical protein